MSLLNEIRELIGSNLADFLKTNWSEVDFKRSGFAVMAAILIIAALLLKKIFLRRLRQRDRSFYVHSGYHFGPHDVPGFSYKILKAIPLLFAAAASFFLLVTLADPYVLLSHESKPIKSREIVYIEDVSASMGFRFKGQRVARAEVVRDFLLRLIAERKDKKDRAAFIVYATNPYRIADFTTDNNSLLFSVENGPLVIADPFTPKIEMYKNLFIVKDFWQEDFGGESDLFLGLEAAMQLFDEKGDPKITKEAKANPSIKRRTVIIATDGASSRDPAPQFQELKKRGIVPYLVYIDPDKEAERKIHGDDSPEVKLPEQLLRQVRSSGGQYFIAYNRSSLEQIRQRLERLHAVVLETKNYTSEHHIYRLPLTFSLLFYALAIMARLAFWKYSRIV